MSGFLSFVLVFGVLVFVHELGHFTVAKLSGVQVDEFGFGYPPRLMKLGTWRGTAITVNLLPIGGFVRMSEDDPSEPASLARKGRGTRALVYVAGALMNVVLAVMLYSITFMLGSLQPVDGPGAGVYVVTPGSPAEQVGIMPGDTIVTIDGQSIDDPQQAVDMIGARVGDPIEVVVRRDGALLEPIVVTPRTNPPPNEGALGVALDEPLGVRTYPMWEAIPLGIRATWGAVQSLFYGIQAAIRGQLPFQVTGVIGIYHITTEVAKTGLVRLLEFTAWLSLNFFLVNLLPLPALDGGRLIFVVLEWVRGGRRVSPEKEGLVHAIGMLVLLALMVVVTVADYMRYFG